MSGRRPYRQTMTPDSFDFFIGSWTSVQRRLVKPLSGSDEWIESRATTRCWSALDGAGNIDEVQFPDWGFTGLTVRVRSKTTGEWSIYWVNSRNGELALPPVTGRFKDGVGTFYSGEDYEGRAITVRYTWSDITQTSARWEQAFSADGGQTWETNWTADFTRSG
jgi:hypothetical protein